MKVIDGVVVVSDKTYAGCLREQCWDVLGWILAEGFGRERESAGTQY